MNLSEILIIVFIIIIFYYWCICVCLCCVCVCVFVYVSFLFRGCFDSVLLIQGLWQRVCLTGHELYRRKGQT